MQISCKRILLLQFILILAIFYSCFAYGDVELGDAEAPVKIIEYGSFTCGKCIRFHRTVFPLLKSHYISAGKVRFIYRDYPTSPEAYRGAIGAHCVDPDQYYRFLDSLYNSVEDWSQSKDVDAALLNIATSLGLNRDKFNSCLNDPEAAMKVDNGKEEAILEYDVFGTPTFIINDKVVRGLKTFDEMMQLIEKASIQAK